jgi:alkylhydroperoxidase/carboxymuconolactone decarboxylase family protein YurZ
MPLNEHQQALKDRFISNGGSWTPLWDGIVTLGEEYFEGYLEMREQPFKYGRLGRKNQQLILVGLEGAVTTLFEPAMKVHMDNAIAAGATISEVFEVIAITSTLGIDAVTNGVPILLDVMSEEGIERFDLIQEPKKETLKQAFISKRGYWDKGWDPVLDSCPDFFEAYTTFSSSTYIKQRGLDPKIKELVFVAINASPTHLNSPALKTHIRNAFRLGVTKEEIIEIFQLAAMIAMHTPMVGCQELLKYMQV